MNATKIIIRSHTFKKVKSQNNNCSLPKNDKKSTKCNILVTYSVKKAVKVALIYLLFLKKLAIKNIGFDQLLIKIK